MRSYTLLAILVLAMLSARAQDFSNKGKEFWLAYSYHVGMNGGGNPAMTLYISSDVATSYQVEVYNSAFSQGGTLAAGQVVTVVIPVTFFINNEGLFTNRAIRVTADKPVVVYSYITRTQASAATVALPVNVLGREYYSMNFRQVSNEANSNSFFTIVAIEDNTVVDITPSVNTKMGWLAGNTYQVTLQKGQIYQVLGATNGFDGADLTGSHIKSVASVAGGCKRIAVFSGSGKIMIQSPGCGFNSSDNLYQQLYPTGSWGKKYVTVPSVDKTENYYRIGRSDPSANVYVNGTLIPSASFVNGFYYEFFNNQPNVIESDKPVSVAQYFTTQRCGNNGGPYDPDMIMLNPVEQNIDKVTLVSSNLQAPQNTYPHQHHIHVVMKTGGTGISSFRLDNNPVSPASWAPHPTAAGYSYLYLKNVGQGYHTLASDSGFNATAYGYGDAESYGYSAGASVKDLYQFVTINNEYATVDFPAACRNAPFTMAMTFPYEPTEIRWSFNGLFPDEMITAPVYSETFVVNGRTLYKYKLPGTYTAPATGTYPIRITATNPTSDGCSGQQEIDYELRVFDPPVASFDFATNGCVNAPVTFTDNSTDPGTRPIIHSYWGLGDGNTAVDVTSLTHTYTAAGSYPVKHTIITDIGCKADTATRIVTLVDPPVAGFNVVAPTCAGRQITFRDNSTVSGATTLTKWTWNFGDGSPEVVATTAADQLHQYNMPGTYTIRLQVETGTGCSSTVFTQTIDVRANPVVDFSLPSICLPSGSGTFTSLSTIADGTENLFSYQWDFGDGSPAGTGASPAHVYTATGSYNVTLAVTSGAGCVTSRTKTFTDIFAEPTATITAPAESCFGTPVQFQGGGTAPGSQITGWQWDFGDNTTSTEKSPAKSYTTPGTYTVRLVVTTTQGCMSVGRSATHTIVVLAPPVADFTISSPGCEGQGVVFSSTSNPVAGQLSQWIWNTGVGGPQTLTSGNPVTQVYPSTGQYQASLQVRTDKGCVSETVTKDLAVDPVPAAAFIPPVICVNDANASFTSTSTINGGSVTGWQWIFGDNNSTPGNPDVTTGSTATHHFTAPGNYNTQLIAISDRGCRDTITNTVTVNGAVLTPAFSFATTGQVCSDQAVTIRDASTVDAGRITRVVIAWDNNDPGAVTTDDTPVPGESYTHSYPAFGSPASRTVTIRYDIYSGITCVNSVTQTLTLLATPQLQFNAIAPVCSADGAFVLPAVTVLNGMNGTGTYSGTAVSTGGSFAPPDATLGANSINYTFTAANGCVATASQIITVNKTPVADAGPDRYVLEGGTVTITPAAAGVNDPVWSWSPSTFLNSASTASVTVTPTEDIGYTLLVTSPEGCSASDQVFVKMLKSPVIPNIFSPNGDGIHDRWEIEHLESYPGCIVQLFNRYGQLVHKLVNYTTPWDGRINGRDAPVGTYYYVIDPRNGRKPITGFVDIIR